MSSKSNVTSMANKLAEDRQLEPVQAFVLEALTRPRFHPVLDAIRQLTYQLCTALSVRTVFRTNYTSVTV